MAEPPPSTQRRVDVSLDDDPAELRPAVSASRLLTTDDWDDLRVCAAETRELAIDEAWVLHPDLARRVVATVEGLQAEVARLTADLAARTTERDAAYQAMWDMHGWLGFDQDGDRTPGAMVAGMGGAGYCRAMINSAAQMRQDYDEACAKAEALRRAREHTVALDPDPGAADSTP